MYLGRRTSVACGWVEGVLKDFVCFQVEGVGGRGRGVKKAKSFAMGFLKLENIE